jgi:hypothetical protein
LASNLSLYVGCSGGAECCRVAGVLQSCMIRRSASSSAVISPSASAPSRLRSRSFATARIWSLTATAERPSHVTATNIGGLAFGELDRGTTITVRRHSFNTFTETTMQGRVFRISEPKAGSSETHQISPRSGITSKALPFHPRSGQTLSQFL